ncbi:MAG: hypothetical protein EA398_01315, partial [Deltaproteobacteria bacterium]
LAGPWGPAFQVALIGLHAVDPEAAPWLADAVRHLAPPEDDPCGVGHVAALASLYTAEAEDILERAAEVQLLLHRRPLPLHAVWRIALHAYAQGAEDVVRWLAGTRDEGADRNALLALADSLAPERDGRIRARRLDPDEGVAHALLHQWVRAEAHRRAGDLDAAIPPLRQVVDADPHFALAGLSLVAALRSAGRRGEALEIAVHLRGLGSADPAVARQLAAMQEALQR